MVQDQPEHRFGWTEGLAVGAAVVSAVTPIVTPIVKAAKEKIDPPGKHREK